MKKHTKNNSCKHPEPLAVLWTHKNNADDADARIFRAYDLLFDGRRRLEVRRVKKLGERIE